MKKKYPIIIAVAIIIIVAIGAYALYSQKDAIIDTMNGTPPAVTNGDDVRREVDFTRTVIFNDNVESIDLVRFPEGTEKIEAQEGIVSSFGLDNRILKRGELLSMNILMKEVAGAHYLVESEVLNERGREAVAISGRFFPVEVTGGGILTVCCFEVYESGSHYVRMIINGELAAEVPFRVEIE